MQLAYGGSRVLVSEHKSIERLSFPIAHSTFTTLTAHSVNPDFRQQLYDQNHQLCGWEEQALTVFNLSWSHTARLLYSPINHASEWLFAETGHVSQDD